jgi:hypothetical protein
MQIAFTYAALNGFEVCAADIRNAYLQAPSSCKDYIICGPEFGIENVGKVALIHCALYGGKSAGRDFRNHLRACMRHLDFVSCLADPDVWMRPAKHSNGSEYYEYILLYTDDCLVIGEQPERTLRNDLGRYFELKEESTGPPKLYLGGRTREVVLENGVKCWTFNSHSMCRPLQRMWKTTLRSRVTLDGSFQPRPRRQCRHRIDQSLMCLPSLSLKKQHITSL